MDQKHKIVLVMVGMPARGKSYIARRLARYLNWTGMKAKVFNIGIYRRIIIGVECDSEFFNQENKEAVKARERCAELATLDLVEFLSKGNTLFNC